MLILCGSAVSFFEKKLLGYKSPLFGRREASLKMKPMNFLEIRGFFPRYTFTELLTIYGVVGGIPAYLEKLSAEKSVDENIKTVITPGTYLYDEALNILRQEVREPRTYFTILSMIAEGRTSPSELASAARIDVRSITKYIELLEELDILRRIRPLGFRKPVKVMFKITTLGFGSRIYVG
ncbi:MAG: AAA family ATPase [Candidatus Njordarchaeales archaeon]